MAVTPQLIAALTTPAFSGMNASTAHTALLAVVSVRQPSDEYSMSGVTALLSANGVVDPAIMSDVESFVRSLQYGPTLASCLMSRGGCDFTLESIQSQLAANLAIEQAAGRTSRAQAVQIMIAIGAREMPHWQSFQIFTEPSVDDVSAGLQTIAAAEWWSQVRDELVPSLLTAGKSTAEIKAAIAAQGG